MWQAAPLTAQKTRGRVRGNSGSVRAHTRARSLRMGSGVGELTRPHKGTLFNLLHIKAQAPQSEAGANSCGRVSVSPALKRFSTAVVHRRGRGFRDRSTRASQSRKPMLWQSEEHSEADAGPSWAHKGLFSTIKGVTLLLRRFEMLILFSTGFWSRFQHEIPQRWW